MTRPNPPSTPLSSSKSAALSRAVDLVAKGYTRYTAGRIPEWKLARFLQKLHARYGIGCSPAQRLTRKQRGLANAALVLYRPSVLPSEREDERASGQVLVEHPAQHPVTLPVRHPPEEMIEWLLLVSPGAGLVEEEEALRDVVAAPKLVWLGYELVRRPNRGRVSWTWRRTKSEMADWYSVLGSQLDARRMDEVAKTLERISRQPGFAGVRQQSWELVQFARSRGYSGEVPYLYFLPKVSQGVSLAISGSES